MKNKKININILLIMPLYIFVLGFLILNVPIVSGQSVNDLLVHFDQAGGDSWINTGNVGIGVLQPSGKFHVQDTQVDVYTSEGISNGWSKNSLTVNGNPDTGYSTLKVWSGHAAVSDRYLLTVGRGIDDVKLQVRTDGQICLGNC